MNFSETFKYKNHRLRPTKGITQDFLKRGMETFGEVVEWVWKVPYGRNSDRSSYKLLLVEGRGTCSTKHALIARIAEEQELPIFLQMGIFMMNSSNTPAVGEILKKYNLDAIPEAHCFLKCGEAKYDITFSDTGEIRPPQYQFICELPIKPEQIGIYKENAHRDFLQKWASSSQNRSGLSFDQLWKIREECIVSLAKSV